MKNNEVLRDEYHQLLVQWRLAMKAGNFERAQIIRDKMETIKVLINK